MKSVLRSVFDILGKCYQKCNQIYSKVTGIRRAMDKRRREIGENNFLKNATINSVLISIITH